MNYVIKIKMKTKNLAYPQKYHDNLQKQAAFDNACDCLWFGCGRKDWNNCGLSPEESDEVWHEAFVYMSNQ